MIKCSAAIPTTSSAVRVAGGQGECVTLTLNLYSVSVDEILALRGHELRLTLANVKERGVEDTDGD